MRVNPQGVGGRVKEMSEKAAIISNHFVGAQWYCARSNALSFNATLYTGFYNLLR